MVATSPSQHAAIRPCHTNAYVAVSVRAAGTNSIGSANDSVARVGYSEKTSRNGVARRGMNCARWK